MKAFQVVLQALSIAFMVLISPANAQAPTTLPCTSPMLASFTPCMNYLTSSSGSGTSPTAACCASLRSIMSNGTDCLCQIIMGGVPFKIPNRNLAISLPKACNQPGVPVQCKASPGAPLPAPGPVAFGPSASPTAAFSPIPSAGTIPATETPALSPVSDTPTALTPSSTGDFVPSTTTTPGTDSSLTPSAAMPSFSLSPSILFLATIILVLIF